MFYPPVAYSSTFPNSEFLDSAYKIIQELPNLAIDTMQKIRTLADAKFKEYGPADFFILAGAAGIGILAYKLASIRSLLKLSSLAEQP